MRRAVRLKYISQSGLWPSGQPRLYFRYRGKKYPLPDAPENSPLFLSAYTKLHEELVGGAPRQEKAPPGSIAATVHAFLVSDEFSSKAENTRRIWRRSLSDIAERYGKAKLVDLRPRHIRQDMADLKPHPANTRLKAWRALCKWALEMGKIDVNPAPEVKMRSTPKSDGFTPWSRGDFETYRAYWPIGTQQRLAFEILYLTCAAIGDACRLGEGNVGNGWITYQRAKSNSVATCPFLVEAPLWSEPDGMLKVALDARNDRHITWIVTEFGKPRSPKAAAQWFSKSCRLAGLEGLSAHGVRKGRAAMFRENGATIDQRLAWLGQETEAEARRYSRSADLQRVIKAGTGSANSHDTSANSSR